MAVLLETSKGDMVIDLHVDACPRTCKNFLKLCKIKYYNDVLFHTVTKDFVVQTGDPTGTGKGGDSVYGKLYGDQARFFEDEIRATLKHGAKGTVSMASGGGENRNASQFLITARADCDALDGKHTVFGVVAEGLDVLDAINEAYCDDRGRPWQNIRIKHTVVLDDPFEDPPGLAALIPDASPTFARDPNDTRLEDDWVPQDAEGANADPAAIERQTREKEARNRAVVLEMIGDLPEADAKPPEESLFVCKLNPITGDEDLEIIFSRFGRVVSCDVVRDHKTGDSLCFAFVTFETREAAETAYLKMDNVLIDDRRVRVDFSQSMHGLWRNFKKFGAKGGTAEDRNAADNARRGPTRGGRDRGVDKTFRGGDGRSTFEIKGSAMGHIGGGGRAPAPRPPEDRAPRERREDDRRRARSRSRDRDRDRKTRRERSRSRDRSRSREREPRARPRSEEGEETPARPRPQPQPQRRPRPEEGEETQARPEPEPGSGRGEAPGRRRGKGTRRRTTRRRRRRDARRRGRDSPFRGWTGGEEAGRSRVERAVFERRAQKRRVRLLAVDGMGVSRRDVRRVSRECANRQSPH